MDKEVVNETHRRVGDLRAAIAIAAEATEGLSEAEALEWTEEFLARKGLTVPANLRTWINEAKGLTAPKVEPYQCGEVVNVRPTPWVWEGLVMAGAMNLLIASPKVGKSALLIGLVGALSRGEASYLGRQLHGGCPKVFIVGTDQPVSDWATLLKREGLMDEGEQVELQAPIQRLWTADRPLHLHPKGICELTELAKEDPGSLFIVDSYHACVSPLGIDEATSAFDGPARRLQEALTAYGCTVVVIHHANKSVSGGNAISASRGSNALPAAASLTVLMNWLKAPAEGQMQTDMRVIVKTMGRAKGSSLLIELEDDGWISHGDGATALQAEELAEAAMDLQGRQADAFDYIADRWELGEFPVSGAELAGHLNLPRNKTHRCLKGLLAKGLIRLAGVVEPGPEGGRPSSLYAPLFTDSEGTSPLPQNGVANVPMVTNPSRTHEIRGLSPLSLLPRQSGGGVVSHPPVDGGETPPRVGQAVEKLQGGEWRNGWVVHDVSNPLELVIAKLGNPLVTFRAQRWGIDIRPCSGSPFAEAAAPAEEDWI